MYIYILYCRGCVVQLFLQSLHVVSLDSTALTYEFFFSGEEPEVAGAQGEGYAARHIYSKKVSTVLIHIVYSLSKKKRQHVYSSHIE
jgi:hypothetical protein